MKPQTTKKLFAFIIVMTILTALPEIVSAQKTPKKCNPQGQCPTGYYCAWGYCYKGPQPCPRCPYYFLTDGSPANEVLSISSANSSAISFYLTQTQNVSAKIYDATGRLVKTLADKIFEQGEHHLQLNPAGVNAGIYMVRFNAGTYREMKKISVIK